MNDDNLFRGPDDDPELPVRAFLMAIIILIGVIGRMLLERQG